MLALADTVRAARALADALGAGSATCPAGVPSSSAGTAASCSGSFPRSRREVGSVGLWFLDGHPDYLDGQTSETGETADMDLAVLTGDGAEPLVTLAGAPPMVPAVTSS